MEEKERKLEQYAELPVPYVAFEREMARAHDRDRRHWIAHVCSLVAILLIVGGFLWYLNQYDFQSYEQDGAGVNVMGNMMGSMNGGEYTNGAEDECP